MIKMSKEIYNYMALLKAKSAFEGVANLCITDETKHWNCHFSKCIYGEKQTALEFENYVIDLMNSK